MIIHLSDTAACRLTFARISLARQPCGATQIKAVCLITGASAQCFSKKQNFGRAIIEMHFSAEPSPRKDSR